MELLEEYEKVTVPVILLVHGFNVRDPEDGIGRLRPLFEAHGFIVEVFNYGFTTLADIRFANPNFARALLDRIRSIAVNTGREVIPVGHSNGCCLIHLAAQLQDSPEYEWVFDRAAYLSPALNRKATNGLVRVDVFHSSHDRTVGWARLLPFSWWGDMGQVGYKGRALTFHNCDATGYIADHSDWWSVTALHLLKSTFVIPMAQRCGMLGGGTIAAPIGFFAL